MTNIHLGNVFYSITKNITGDFRHRLAALSLYDNSGCYIQPNLFRNLRRHVHHLHHRLLLRGALITSGVVLSGGCFVRESVCPKISGFLTTFATCSQNRLLGHFRVICELVCRAAATRTSCIRFTNQKYSVSAFQRRVQRMF